MIPAAELKRIASQKGVALSVVEKDYALTWILCALSRIESTDNFVFKGGTALRKVYFPEWRYSEDLDFTLLKKFKNDELKEIMERIKAFLSEHQGIILKVKSLYSNPEYAQLKIQFAGPLGHENTIKFDLSFKELVVLKPEEKTILSEYSDKEDYSLWVYPLEEILAEKIRSILQRGKTRDYYDVWKILKEHFGLVDKEKTRWVLTEKCRFKNLVCNAKILFDKEKLGEAEKHWEKGLAHQIDNLPDFKMVIEECKKLIRGVI